jgi:hypothetical protein
LEILNFLRVISFFSVHTFPQGVWRCEVVCRIMVPVPISLQHCSCHIILRPAATTSTAPGASTTTTQESVR